MNRSALESLDKATLIQMFLAQSEILARALETIRQLEARVAELEARLGLPPKGPDNSPVPPSKGAKPSSPATAMAKGRPHEGASRALSANPTRFHDCRAQNCGTCGHDVAGAAQIVCETWDHVEIPDIKPDVTQVRLFGGTCPCCRGKFKAPAPAGMPRGALFGPNLRALALYLRFTQGIGFERLAILFKDMLGVEISEGALVGIVHAGIPAFARQAGIIKARLLGGPVIASDETGLRVGKCNWWLWVFHHGDSAVFVADPRRARSVPETFLGDFRPNFWLSDRYGGQMGLAGRENQICLAHLLRDTQYAIDAGDGIFAPALRHLPGRACKIGRCRPRLKDATLKQYKAGLERDLDRIMALAPGHPAGLKLQRAIVKCRRHMFVFATNRDIEATNNSSERALRPAVTFRKITNGFRTAWGAKLYADIRSTLETARRRAIGALQAIRLTLAKKNLPLTA